MKFSLYSLVESWGEVQDPSGWKERFLLLKQEYPEAYAQTLYHLLTCDYCIEKAPHILRRLSHPLLGQLGQLAETTLTCLPVSATQNSPSPEALFYLELFWEKLQKSPFRSQDTLKDTLKTPSVSSSQGGKTSPLSKRTYGFLLFWTAFNTFLLFLVYFSALRSTPALSPEVATRLLRLERRGEEQEHQWKKALQEQNLPVGTILGYYGLSSEVPQGFLPCRGQTISFESYPELSQYLAKNAPHLLQKNSQEPQIRLPLLESQALPLREAPASRPNTASLGSLHQKIQKSHTHLNSPILTTSFFQETTSTNRESHLHLEALESTPSKKAPAPSSSSQIHFVIKY